MSQFTDLTETRPGRAPSYGDRTATLIAGLTGWKRDLVLSILSQIVQKLPGLVAAMVLARHFEKDLMGQFFFCGVVATMAATISHLGTDRELRRSVAQRPEAALDMLGQVLSLRLVVVPVLWIAINLAVALAAPELLAIFALTTAYILAGDLFFSFSAVFVGLRWMGLRLVVGAIGPLLIALSSLVVLLGWSLPAVLVLYVGANAAMVAAALAATRARLGLPALDRRRSALRTMLAVSAPFLFIELILLLQSKIDVLMLFALRTPVEVAEYEVAYRLLEVTRTLVRPLMMVFVPIAAAMAVTERASELPRLIAKLLAAVTLAGIVIAGACIAFAEPILVAVWGEAYRPGAGVFAILALSTIPLFIVMASVHLASSLRRERACIGILAGTAVANAALNAAIIPGYGAVGAAWTTFATECAAALVLTLMILGSTRRMAGRGSRNA